MLSNFEIILRLSTAAILGGLIGFERERISWFAGLRTHMLVCLGATLIMIVSQFGFEEAIRQNLVILDPSRVAAQVVSGIGFLGAGTILVWREMIRGLTTAASLWAVAAVGLAVGGGLYFASVITTALALLILAGLKPIEKRFLKKKHRREIKILIQTGMFSTTSLQHIFSSINWQPSELKIETIDGKEVFHVMFDSISQDKLLNLIDKIRDLPGIEKIEFS